MAETQNRRTDSVTKTSAVAAGTAGSGAFLTWVFQMLAAHAFLMPSPELIMLMGATVFPITEALYARAIHKIERGDTDAKNTGGPKP